MKALLSLGFFGLFLLSVSGNAQRQQPPPEDTAIAAKETALKSALFQMRDAIDRYYVDKKRYPQSLDSLTTGKYLDRIPSDPFTNSTHSWRTLPTQPDRRHPTATRGIYDVKSTSTSKALDGTKYSEW